LGLTRKSAVNLPADLLFVKKDRRIKDLNEPPAAIFTNPDRPHDLRGLIRGSVARHTHRRLLEGILHRILA
jgi:hypothetical protein